MPVLYQIEFDLIIEEGEGAVSDEAIGSIQQEARLILEEGGQDIVTTAQGIVSVGTGRLQASIFYAVVDVQGLILGTGVPYGGFVEKRRPFLQPAIDEHQPMIQENLDNMIADHLNRDNAEDDPELEFDVEMEYLGER